MVLSMTDEAYSILCSASYPEEVESAQVAFYVELFCHAMFIAQIAPVYWLYDLS